MNILWCAAVIELVLLIGCTICIVVLAKKCKRGCIEGGDIIVNRNDPTRDYIKWELITWPDDWKDGDRLIFTVVEHKVVQSGPEVEVKK